MDEAYERRDRAILRAEGVPVILSLAICLVAYAILAWILRRDRVSLGLPFAYLSTLLLIHVPGAFAHVIGAGTLLSQLPGAIASFDSDQFVEIGIRYAAIGAACFVVGVAIAHFHIRPEPVPPSQPKFTMFCTVAGFLFVLATSSVANLPSVNALIDRSSVVWVLGALLGLRAAVRSRDFYRMALWAMVPVAFSIVQIFAIGFLSYASTDIIIVASALVVNARKYWHIFASVLFLTVFGLNVFVNYFENRDDIRTSIGLNATIQQRLNSVNTRDLHFFNPSNPDDLAALDQRLNQNLFVGLAAVRIDLGAAEYEYGNSIVQGLIALVPRALWPDKPVFGGSPQIVAEMTGLQLNQNTSFGVGNVMEFYINFGMPSLIIGFILLGWIIAVLDIKAAQADSRGQLGTVLLYFLPAVALIQPNGSIVEMSGGVGAALVAAYIWRGAWLRWSGRAATTPQPAVAATTISDLRH